MAEDLQYRGRPIRLRGNTAPPRRYRGFFAGDDYHGHDASDPDAITVEFDGQVFDLHRTTDGDFHAHDLPTMSFTSVEQAAETIARLVDQGILHGRSAQSEPTE